MTNNSRRLVNGDMLSFESSRAPDGGTAVRIRDRTVSTISN